MSSISHKIEKLLEAKSLTKSRFAELIGVNRDTVYNLTDETIKLSTLLKISEVLGVSISHFLPNSVGNNQQKIVSEPKESYKKPKKSFIDISAANGININLKTKQIEIL